jgi:hypothetical protein
MLTCIASWSAHGGIGVGVMQCRPVKFVRTERSFRPVEQINWTTVGQEPVDERSAENTVGRATYDCDSMRWLWIRTSRHQYLNSKEFGAISDANRQ